MTALAINLSLEVPADEHDLWTLREVDRETHDHGDATVYYTATLSGREYEIQASFDNEGPVIDCVGGNDLNQEEAEAVTAWALATLRWQWRDAQEQRCGL